MSVNFDRLTSIISAEAGYIHASGSQRMVGCRGILTVDGYHAQGVHPPGPHTGEPRAGEGMVGFVLYTPQSGQALQEYVYIPFPIPLQDSAFYRLTCSVRIDERRSAYLPASIDVLLCPTSPSFLHNLLPVNEGLLLQAEVAWQSGRWQDVSIDFCGNSGWSGLVIGTFQAAQKAKRLPRHRQKAPLTYIYLDELSLVGEKGETKESSTSQPGLRLKN